MNITSHLYYRSLLDEHDQAVYDALVEGLRKMEDSFSLPLSHIPFNKIISAVKEDIPAFFYVNYWKAGSCWEYPHKIQVEGGYLYTRQEAKALLKDVEKWGSRVLTMMPEGLDDTTKALWLRDIILLNCKYGDSENPEAHSIIGVIKNKTAVCEGIAAAYKYLCDLGKIPCITVTGKLDHSGHSWNLIWINGEPAFVDATQDITAHGAGERAGFIRNEEQMPLYEWDHSIIPKTRLKNTTNPFIRVHSREELFDQALKNSHCSTTTFYLDESWDLKAGEMNDLCGLLYLKLRKTGKIELLIGEKSRSIFLKRNVRQKSNPNKREIRN